jgi:hypothetical protein
MTGTRCKIPPQRLVNHLDMNVIAPVLGDVAAMADNARRGHR